VKCPNHRRLKVRNRSEFNRLELACWSGGYFF
jgi:hypothetical protein